MKISLDNVPLEFDCPKCGHHLKKPVRWFKNKNNTCPGCGAAFKTDGITAGEKKVNKALEDFGRKLKRRFPK